MNAPALDLLPNATSGAIFSLDRVYRYRLWREWDRHRPTVAFIMLNPSTADEFVNDPTIERCQRRVRQLGYGALIVLNLFGLRSTYPVALYDHHDPVGPENDQYIVDAVLQIAAAGGIVICGWGQHGKLRDRGEQVRQMLMRSDVEPMALAINQDGTPKHPLYIGYEAQPKVWRA